MKLPAEIKKANGNPININIIKISANGSVNLTHLLTDTFSSV